MLQLKASATINGGIIKFLVENGNLKRWQNLVEEEFDIVLEGSNITEYKVTGQFKNILSFEAYLDTKFPKDPNDINFREDHFGDDEKQATSRLQINEIAYKSLVKLGKLDAFSKIEGVCDVTYEKDVLLVRGTIRSFKKVEEIVKSLCRDVVTFSDRSSAEKAYKKISNQPDMLMYFGLDKERVWCYSDFRDKVCKSFSQLLNNSLCGQNIFGRRCLYNMKVELVEGDIQNADADCIVLSSPQRLKNRKGAAKAVESMLGNVFAKNCEAALTEYGEIMPGKCRVVESGLSRRQYIANVNVPRWQKDDQSHSLKMFEEFLKSCLIKVDSMGCLSMAMTCIGSG